MKRMLIGKILMCISAVLTIAGLNLLFVRTAVEAAVNPVTVPVAIRDIAAGTRVSAEDIDLITVPGSLVTQHACSCASEVIGRTVRTDQSVPAGSLFYETVLEDKKRSLN